MGVGGEIMVRSGGLGVGGEIMVRRWGSGGGRGDHGCIKAHPNRFA